MKPRRMLWRGLTLTVVAGLTGTLLSVPAAGDDTETAAPEWGACPDGVATTVPLECATVPVPLDYDAPDGTQIDITISRVASTKPAARQGVLLTNPGGPGSAGLTMPADLVQRGIPSSVLDAYDVVGMDPRGVGHSAPVSCGFTLGQDYMGNIPPYAPDAAAVAEHAKTAEAVADQCAANDPEGRMQHMTTANAARDMDRIRVALGEEKLSFFGASYGSGLGAAYASLFPEQGDRIVLDSNLGATSLDRDTQRRFGPGLEDRFPDFAKWVAQRHGSYELGRTPKQVRAGYLELADQLDRRPVAGLDGATFRFYTFVGLYSDGGFGTVAQIWQAAASGDTEAVRRQAQTLPSTTPGGPGAGAAVASPVAAPVADGTQQPDAEVPAPADNAWSAYLAYACNDSEWPEDLATYQRDVAADRKRYPLYGGAAANINPCAYWHNDPAEPPVEIVDEGPQNVLVVQNLRDPGTPYLGGQLARKAFGDRAALVSVHDGGHGAYVYGGNACALNTTTRYLVDGDLPKDTFCRPTAG